MKAKWIFAIGLVLSLGLVTACGGPEEEPAAPDSQAPASVAAPVVTSSEPISSSEPESSEPESSSSEPAPAEVTPQEGEVLYNGVILTPNADFAALQADLGEPVNYSENISCMFEGGLDKTYEYEGMTVFTYPTADGQELILSLEITGANVPTARGVKVGDAIDTALAAYGDELADQGYGSYTATYDGTALTVMEENGAVFTIFYDLAT